MNPSNIYKKDLLNKNIKNKKKFVFKTNESISHKQIYTKTPNIETPIMNSNKNEINYYLDNLNKNIDINSNDLIHICLFTIETNSKYPYLLYLLYKNEENILTFPYLYYSEGNLEELCKNKINQITDFNSEYKGCIKNEKNVYVFFQLDNNSYSPCFIEKKDNWWFALIYEICYLKKLNNYSIDKLVYNCFLNNCFLTLLYDNKNISHEIPIPLYIGSHDNDLKYLISFGAHKILSNKSIHGNFYYYYSYESACRYGLWNENFEKNELSDNSFGRYLKGGLVRFACFVGNTKVFLNTLDSYENNNIIDEYKKISDKKSIWAKNYDSVFIGNFKINDLEQIGYRYTLKSNSQVSPLSYHYLNKDNIGGMYDSKKKYEII